MRLFAMFLSSHFTRLGNGISGAFSKEKEFLMKCQVGVDVSKKTLVVAAMVEGMVLLLKEFDNN